MQNRITWFKCPANPSTDHLKWIGCVEFVFPVWLVISKVSTRRTADAASESNQIQCKEKERVYVYSTYICIVFQFSENWIYLLFNFIKANKLSWGTLCEWAAWNQVQFRICCCVGLVRFDSFVCLCLGNDEVHDENKDNIIYVLCCTHHPLTRTTLLGEGCVAVSACTLQFIQFRPFGSSLCLSALQF